MRQKGRAIKDSRTAPPTAMVIITAFNGELVCFQESRVVPFPFIARQARQSLMDVEGIALVVRDEICVFEK
jgi:hypothetical protein